MYETERKLGTKKLRENVNGDYDYIYIYIYIDIDISVPTARAQYLALGPKWLATDKTGDGRDFIKEPHFA